MLIHFWAPSNGPSLQFAPVYEHAAAANPDLVFGKVDVDAEPELAGAFNFRSVPALMIVRDGAVLFSQAGHLTATALDELIEQARAVDMDEVRRELQEQSSGE
ncbi:thioredoxin family protein [Streptomyces griseoluteus]|uniref:thioredoxin family protein n=1 Tax=Streptomyces griseoluteus TaxID=29306 RepID=UPI0037F6CB7D